MSAGAVVLQFPRRPPGAAPAVGECAPAPAGGAGAVETLAESVRQMVGVVQQLVQILAASKTAEALAVLAAAALTPPVPEGPIPDPTPALPTRPRSFVRRRILSLPRDRPTGRKPGSLPGIARLLNRVREGRSVGDDQDLDASVPFENQSANGFLWCNQRVSSLLQNLAREYRRGHPDKAKDAFFEEVYGPLRSAAFAGDDMNAYVNQIVSAMRKTTPGKLSLEEQQRVSMRAASSYAAASFVAMESGHEGDAWEFACEAEHWGGYLSGLAGTSIELFSESRVMSNLGEKGRKKLHAWNRAQKRLVYRWANDHRNAYPAEGQLNSMALQIVADKVTELDFSRVRKHLTDWKAEVAIPED